MNTRQVNCPQHGERVIDLDDPDRESMCEACRVVGPDGKPLGWADGRPTKHGRDSDLYLCPVCDAVIETAPGAHPVCPNGPHDPQEGQ